MASLDYRPDVDGLRAIAVVAVVLHHLSATLAPGGYVGVDVFFVISGYLITRIIQNEIVTNRFTFRRFYERRARRIFPALFVVLATSLVAGYIVLLPSDFVATLRAAIGTVFFASNIVFWRTMAAGYFAATDAAVNPLLHTWSLAVEEQFYLLFPVVLLVVHRWFRRYLFLFLAVSACISFAAAAFLVRTKSVAVFFFTPFRVWELLAGSLLALHALPALRSRVQGEIIAAAGLLAVLVPCFLYDHKTTFPGTSALAPVLGASALIYAGSVPNSVTRLLQSRPFVYVGLISYSLYLWHWPIIVLLRYRFDLPETVAVAAGLFATSLAVAALSHRFVETPFRRQTGFSRGLAIAVGSVAAALVGLVTIGLRDNGVPSRFPASAIRFDQDRSPVIPFVACDARPPGGHCVLGAPNRDETVLLLGDSHMLALAPVFDSLLAQRNIAAAFMPMSACSPLLVVGPSVTARCSSHGNGVQDYLRAHPKIDTVVLSAFWSAYFGRGPSPSSNELVVASNPGLVQRQFVADVLELTKSGKKVVLVGPIPIYDRSVPFDLARTEATGRVFPDTNANAQRALHSTFFDAVRQIQNATESVRFQFIDPLATLCPDNCRVVDAGQALYRDRHHLSVVGALAFESDFARSLYSLLFAQQDSDTLPDRHLPSDEPLRRGRLP